MAALILITGASRGFGKALALELSRSTLSSSSTFVLTGRDKVALDHVATDIKAACPSSDTVTLQYDFANINDIDATFTDVLLTTTAKSTFDHVVLVNNAGSLGRLLPTHQLSHQDFASTIQVNVTAPLTLTSCVMRFMSHHRPDIKLTIVNISSLAAVKPFECWSMYCAGKAARDMFFRCIAAETSEKLHPLNARVLNYAPGPLDTDMQSQIRDTMPATSSLRQVFHDMHQRQQLVTPTASARKLVSLLEQDSFANGEHIDYYDI